ncbi:hypothetical protein [Sphingomonas bacterium]|uniref:hypothetical protein n=1 Tax=Sphingomonas bacterium TaxID=1895847 RepID=UPI0015771FD1|nr:hypothetical protein [Sphingomonas bacterium]
MTESQMIGLVGSLCAILLVGSGIVRRRMDPRSIAALVAAWAGIILLGMLLANLWLRHRG